ncbi:MAG: polymer-forming cytoskeletal protein [Steroidobacteraceae bacterium]|jgi:cytoskeletal protein CcmA (bactofilin family)
MSDLPRRRLMDRLGSTPTLIAQHTVLRGDIETQGALLINGTVQGNARVGGEIAISSGARWEGNIRARRAVIAGEVSGDVSVDEKLEIGASARIHGRVTAQLIAIAHGAQVEGEIICTGKEPVIEFEEKRAALD